MIEVSCVLARILINAVYKLILSYCNNMVHCVGVTNLILIQKDPKKQSDDSRRART